MPATLKEQNVSRDVCFLDAPGLREGAAPRRSGVVPGQKIYAVGFPAQTDLTITQGEVIALHDYDRATVIQVSAPFHYGSSGGGLFDGEGRLVGMLTFKARAGGSFHFAVPVAWLDMGRRVDHIGSTTPFWRRDSTHLPHFLRAASLEAAGNWNALALYALEWLQEQPAHPGAARAFATARLRGGALPSRAPDSNTASSFP